MTQRRFSEVDVFTDEPYMGNALAVVLDSEGLDTETMARFARWINLSETTFLLPPVDPAADYRVRIFTPSTELPFAGHPTLGSCHTWLHAGGRPRDPGIVVQECGAGLVKIRRSASELAFAGPALVRSGPVDAALADRVTGMLGIGGDEVVAMEWVDNGPGWIGVLLADADAVLAVRPGPIGDLDVGVVGPHPPGSAQDWEVRAWFGVGGSTVEDPVTGSLNASLAEWLIRTGRAGAPYVARQGTAIGRRGLVRVTADDDGTIWTGGSVVTCIEGHVEL